MAKNMNQTLQKLDKLLNTKAPGRYLGPLDDTGMGSETPDRPQMKGLLVGFASWLTDNGVSSVIGITEDSVPRPVVIPNDILEATFCSKVIDSIKYEGIAFLDNLTFTRIVDTDTLLPLFSKHRVGQRNTTNGNDLFIKWSAKSGLNAYGIFITPKHNSMGFIFMSPAMNKVYDNLIAQEAPVETMIQAFQYFDSNISHTKNFHEIPNSCTQLIPIDDEMEMIAQAFHSLQREDLNRTIPQPDDATPVQNTTPVQKNRSFNTDYIPDPYAILPEKVATSILFWESSIHAFFPDSIPRAIIREEKVKLKRLTEKENPTWQYCHSFKLNNEKIVIMTKTHSSGFKKVCAIGTYDWQYS